VDFRHIIETVGEFVDFAGVAVMVIGALVSIPLARAGTGHDGFGAATRN